jgi:hypothetical protein
MPSIKYEDIKITPAGVTAALEMSILALHEWNHPGTKTLLTSLEAAYFDAKNLPTILAPDMEFSPTRKAIRTILRGK